MIGRLTTTLGRARYLDQPLRPYEPFAVCDPTKLAAVLRPGDVLLVEGDTRVSTAIKYLTQSTWSHAALYVGDFRRTGLDPVEAPVGRYRRAAAQVRPPQHAHLPSGRPGPAELPARVRLRDRTSRLRPGAARQDVEVAGVGPAQPARRAGSAGDPSSGTLLRAAHSFAWTSSQPFPRQAFWPVHALKAVLHAVVPLQLSILQQAKTSTDLCSP